MADDMPANNDNSTLGLHRIEDYAPVIGREAVEPILTKDRRLCFARIGHADGGADILASAGPSPSQRIGAAARETVGANFLLSRLAEDWIDLLVSQIRPEIT